MLRDLNRGKHRAVHSLEGNQVATGVGHSYVHFPIAPDRLCYCCVNDCLRLLERYRGPVGHIERYFIRDGIKRIRRRDPCIVAICVLFADMYFLS